MVEEPLHFVQVALSIESDDGRVHPACAGERTAAPVRIDFIIYREAVIAVAFRSRYLVVIVAGIVIVVAAAVAVVVFFVLIVGSTGLMTAIVALVIINVGLLMLQCECTQGTHTHVTH